MSANHGNDSEAVGGGAIGILLGPERKTLVRVVYSDESGIGSEKDEPLTVVAALMLNVDSQWHPVLESIEKALRDILGRENLSTYEIRSRNLYHQIRRGDARARALMSAIMKIPQEHLVPVFYGAIDRAGYMFFMREIYTRSVYSSNPERRMNAIKPPLDTFSDALIRCINRVDSFVHTTFPDEQVLWIHDKGKYDDDAKSRLHHVRDMGSGELGPILRQFDVGFLERSHVVDTIYFGHSRESRALQLADACCSTITRHLRGDPFADPYYDLLKSQVVNDGNRPEYENVEETWKRMQQAKGKKDAS